MRKVVQMLIFSIATSNIAYAASAISNELSYNDKKQTTAQKVLSKFNFNYFAKYTGRSLSDNYENGATYNRFSGGHNDEGMRQDSTGSTQLYQSFKLSYTLPKNMQLGYGVTFQDSLTKGVKYAGDYGGTYTRNHGRSYNDQQISLWIPNILSNNKASLSTTLIYQRPTTDASKASGVRYRIGIQPTLSIYSKVAGLQHGFTASYQRDSYPKYQYSEMPSWCSAPGYTCQGVTPNTIKKQGVRANMGAYLNYMVSNKITLKSSVQIDYDQRGDQVGSLNKWGNNLDNIGNIGAAYFVRKGVNIATGVTFSLDQASIEKTSIFGSLSLSI